MGERRVEEIAYRAWLIEAISAFGIDTMAWRFRCARCDTVQSLRDFIAAGMTDEAARPLVGFSCIGRLGKGTGCDWTLGGFLLIHRRLIVFPDGQKAPVFEFDDVATPMLIHEAAAIVADKWLATETTP